ncbi:MAG: DUF2914 domain-containing protein [Methylobacter sp.]
MTDKRNIVIKVSYPVAGKAAENAAPKMVTEWNVKRILLAVGVLVLVLAALIYGISNDTEKTDVDNTVELVNAIDKSAEVKETETETKNLDIPKQVVAETSSLVKSKNELNKKVASIPVKEVIKKQPKGKVIKEHGYSKVNPNVPRAVLTYAINNKEPTSEVVKSVDVSHKKPVWLYYFTELKAMKGSKVYHEWLKNGTIVSRQELVISDDTWRTSSRKLLSDSEKGNWTARLVDKDGRLLNEKNFKVE